MVIRSSVGPRIPMILCDTAGVAGPRYQEKGDPTGSPFSYPFGETRRDRSAPAGYVGRRWDAERESKWAKRVERWCESGLTAQEYAAEIGVNANTLQHWGWRLRNDAGEKATRKTGKRAPTSPVPLVEVVGWSECGATTEVYECTSRQFLRHPVDRV